MIAEHKLILLSLAEKGASGLGIHFNNDTGKITYLRKSSGAEKAGIRPDDRITAIDGVKYDAIKDPLSTLLGECGVSISLTIYRPFKFLGFDIGKTGLMQIFGVPTSEYGTHYYIVDRLPFRS